MAGTIARKRRLKCSVLAVPFSPNLGDGIIYECLRYGLQQVSPDLDVEPIDLAGRADYSKGAGAKEVWSRRLLSRLPPMARGLVAAVVFGLLQRKKLFSYYQRKLHGADFVIVGGGQLFSEVALNFPIKLGIAADVLEKQQVPVGIYSVGVPDRMSATGQRLFGRLLSRLRVVYASARDARSSTRLSALLPPSNCVHTVRDPAVLAGLVYPASKVPSGTRRPTIGINVISPLALELGGDHALVDRWGTEIYRQMAELLNAAGYGVEFFTNGSFDDENFLKELRLSFQQSPPAQNVYFHDRAQNPGGLAAVISSFDGIIAHRLHALIVGFSFGIPGIGFSRDAKVSAFFDSLNLHDRCLGADAEPPIIVQTLLVAVALGPTLNLTRKVQQDALLQLEQVAEVIHSSTSPRDFSVNEVP